MDKKILNMVIALVVVVGFFAGAMGGGVASFILYRSTSHDFAAGFAPPMILKLPPPQTGWHSSEVAKTGTVEALLRKQGKQWTPTTGTFAVGSFVLDKLEGRQNQPRGRGAVGRIKAMTGPNDAPPPCADVDFGAGYVTGINLSELTLVQVHP